MPGAELGKLAARLEADSRRFQQELRAAGGSLDRLETRGNRFSRGFNRSMGRAFSATQRVARGVFSMRGAMVAAAGATGFALLFRRTVASADALQKLSQRTAISAEELQRLGFAAEQAGSSEERLNRGLETFSRRLGQAANEQGTLFTELKKTNPALLEQLTAAESVREALGLYADAVAAAETPMERAQLAAAGFSRSVGLELVNFLQQGDRAIRSTGQELDALGATLSNETVAASAKTEDAINKLSRVFRANFSKAVLGVQDDVRPLFETLSDPETIERVSDLADDTARLARWIVSTGLAAKDAKDDVVGFFRDIEESAGTRANRLLDQLGVPRLERRAEEGGASSAQARIDAQVERAKRDPRFQSGGTSPPGLGPSTPAPADEDEGRFRLARPNDLLRVSQERLDVLEREAKRRDEIESRITRDALEAQGQRAEIIRLEADERRELIRSLFGEGERRESLLERVSETERARLAELAEQGRDTFDVLGQSADLFAGTFGRVISDAVRGAEVDFERLAASFAGRLAEMEAQALATDLLGALTGRQGGGGQGGGDDQQTASLIASGLQLAVGVIGGLFGGGGAGGGGGGGGGAGGGGGGFPTVIGLQEGGVVRPPGGVFEVAEAGKPEVVAPLDQLLAALGEGGPSVEVNIIGAPSEPRVRESRRPDGGVRLDVEFDQMSAGAIRRGPETNRALAERGLIRRGTRRG